jgi:hypothetical protein
MQRARYDAVRLEFEISEIAGRVIGAVDVHWDARPQHVLRQPARWLETIAALRTDPDAPLPPGVDTDDAAGDAAA